MISFKQKSFEEQVKEAEKHSYFGAIRKKSSLAATAYDHIIVGGTPPDNRMLDHPEKPLADLMTNKEIEAYLDLGKIVRFFETTLEEAEKELQKRITVKDAHFPLVEDILYLSEIGRLPEKFQKYLK